MGKSVNVDFKIYDSLGFDYLKNPSTLFFKGESDNETAQK